VPEGFGGLEPYYEFASRVFSRADGSPIGRRAAQKIAKKYNLPLIRMGNSAFIDPAIAAEQLRAMQLVDHADREPRKPGRPRKAP
jgi:hypothetical protein